MAASASVAGQRIGIPRSLIHHIEPELLTTFVEGLGATPVLSPQTNRRILERGVSLSVDEACLPVKIHLGHVDALRGSVDRVLVPRIASTTPAFEDTCVRFWALHDITANTFPDLPVVGFDVDTHLGRRERDQMVALGRRLGATRRMSQRAYADAKARSEQARNAREAEQARRVAGDERARVLAVGHRYLLEDALVGGTVLNLLAEEDVCVLRSDHADERACLERYAEISPRLKWRYNREQVGAVAALRGQVDGILLLVSFPCGPDSLVAELCQRRVTEAPIATIVLDEHTSATGLKTRIESFCDIVKLRRAS
jgi:predicted nucleotide-binding protein (sugar kinase/HSP70/actin superfamily)